MSAHKEHMNFLCADTGALIAILERPGTRCSAVIQSR